MATKKTTKKTAKTMFSDVTYDRLKYICQVALPAVIFLWAAISAIWGLPFAIEVEKTITAVAVFIEMLLGLTVTKAAADYKKANKK